jgi:hypothetical protein
MTIRVSSELYWVLRKGKDIYFNTYLESFYKTEDIDPNTALFHNAFRFVSAKKAIDFKHAHRYNKPIQQYDIVEVQTTITASTDEKIIDQKEPNYDDFTLQQ